MTIFLSFSHLQSQDPSPIHHSSLIQNTSRNSSLDTDYHNYVDIPAISIQTGRVYISKEIETVGGNSNIPPTDIVFKEHTSELVGDPETIICPVLHAHNSDVDANWIRKWKTIQHTDHYMITSHHETKSIKEIVDGSWVSEIIETHPIKDMKAFFVCEPMGLFDQENDDEQEGHSKSIVVVVRMENEIALWIKIQLRWICFGRYQAYPFNVLSDESSKKTLLWDCGTRNLLYDVRVWNQNLVLVFASRENSFRKATSENVIGKDMSVFVNKTSTSKVGAIGLVSYDLMDVKARVMEEIEKRRKEHQLSKYILLIPLSCHFQSVHESQLQIVKLNQDGSHLATASTRGTVIRLIDTRSKETILTLRRGKNLAFIHSIAFSPNSRYICCTSTSLTLHLFDIQHCLEESKKSEQNRWYWNIYSDVVHGKNYSICQYKGLKGKEIVCCMPNESSIYVLNNLGQLSYLHFNMQEISHITTKNII